MIPQKTIDATQEHFGDIYENRECGQPAADPADALDVSDFGQPPLELDDYIQQEDLSGLIELEQWEIDAGVWLGKDGNPNVGYKMCNMSELNRDSVKRQAAEEQPHIQPMANNAGGSDLIAAVTFLRAELADGPLPGKVVYSAAVSIGISKRTLERAKSQISVLTRRIGAKGKRGAGIWSWELPADLHRQDGDLNDPGSEIDLHRQHSQLRKPGAVNQNHAGQTASVASAGILDEYAAVAPKIDTAVDRREAILGMPVNAAVEIWRLKGSPVFTSRQGEHLRDLDALLSNPDCQERHLKVVRAWIDKFHLTVDSMRLFNSYIRL